MKVNKKRNDTKNSAQAHKNASQPVEDRFDAANARGTALGRAWAVRLVGDLCYFLGWVDTMNESSPVEDIETFGHTGALVIFRRELKQGDVDWNRGFVAGFLNGALPLIQRWDPHCMYLLEEVLAEQNCTSCGGNF